MNETLAKVEGFFTAFSIVPMTPQVIVTTATNDGNPFHLTPSVVPGLSSRESDLGLSIRRHRVLSAHTEANVQINAVLKAGGFSELPLVYLSDAENGQSVFPTYGEGNWQRLKSVRDFYDPKLVYTVFLNDGDKVALAREKR